MDELIKRSTDSREMVGVAVRALMDSVSFKISLSTYLLQTQCVRICIRLASYCCCLGYLPRSWIVFGATVEACPGNPVT